MNVVRWSMPFAEAVLGLSITRTSIERLAMDRALKQLCGFSMWKQVQDEVIFSHAFAEFSQTKPAEHVHESLVKKATFGKAGGLLLGRLKGAGNP